jgi:hypothetical protein
VRLYCCFIPSQLERAAGQGFARLLVQRDLEARHPSDDMRLGVLPGPRTGLSRIVVLEIEAPIILVALV